MYSLKSLYKIGMGPSSSHTFGPRNAAAYFKKICPDADKYRVILYGSLAYTGKGHCTDKAILSVIPEAEVIFDTDKTDLFHPNTMLFEGYKAGKIAEKKEIISIGGGLIQIEGEEPEEELNVYPEKNFTEIMEYCNSKKIRLYEYVREHEGDEVFDHLKEVWHVMEDCVRRGVTAEGILPGGLGVVRKAKKLNETRCYNESDDTTKDRQISAYAYAVSEENASGGIVVTAPTCGSAGVLPAVLYYMRYCKGFPEEEIINALATAGVVGNVIRTNASISGAECGCQAEIGSACSMTAAGVAELYGLSLNQIEYSAEVAMEHHLGLTCDPVNGLVQIPCIERNAVAAMRALNCVSIARFLADTRKISFDAVIETMARTGHDILEAYRETSHGGLAKLYNGNDGK